MSITHLHKPNNPITCLWTQRIRHTELTDYMVGYRDGTSRRVEAIVWHQMILVSNAQWDRDNATYWVNGANEPDEGFPTSASEAFGGLL